MNYNAQAGSKQPFSKKIKRISDVNAMGYNPYDNSNNVQQNLYPNLDQRVNSFDVVEQAGLPDQPNPYNTQYVNTPRGPQMAPQVGGFGYSPSPSPAPYVNVPPMPQNLGVIGQPIMQDMAMQYGQQLAGAGSSLIKKEVEKYVPVTKLKYYFAVDTKYVISKLVLLFFPFTHSDWSVKYEQDGPVQPRFELNAPDLYIPSMAYFTYVLIAGLVLGMQDRFSPEQIGILASSALAWCVVELAVYSCILYILHVQTTLKTLDLLAYAGYKFIGIIVSILVSLFTGRTGFYISLVYSNFALAFFLIRSLKVQVLSEAGGPDTGYYVQSHTPGHKRRLYFLLFVACIQPVLSWWLSFHLILAPAKAKV